MSQPTAGTSHDRTPIIVALISLVGVLVAAYLGYLGTRGPSVNVTCQINTSELSLERAVIEVNQSILVSVRADNPNGRALLYDWQAVNGRMTPSMRSSTPQSTYTAPAFPVDDAISVVITLPDCDAVRRTQSIAVVNSSANIPLNPSPTTSDIVPTTKPPRTSPPELQNKDPYANGVLSFKADGEQNTHTDPKQVIGPQDCDNPNLHLSLGGGFVVLDMGEGEEIVNAAGSDFTVYETDASCLQAGEADPYEVFVGNSAQGPWITVGTRKGTSNFDLDSAAATLDNVRYLRIEDRSPNQPMRNDSSPGADINAVEALHLP